MGKTFERICDIVTLIGGAVTLGGLLGIKKMEKKENTNESNNNENTEASSTNNNQ